MAAPIVFTVGHSTHSQERFLRLLRDADITAIADVRSSPWSRHCPHFNRPDLKSLLRQNGLDYRYFGKQLGGRPSDPSLFDGGIADYQAMARTPLFQEGLERVIAGAQKHRLALMCSEQDPLDCHRCLLVGRRLSEKGLPVSHLLASGGAMSQVQVEERLLALSGQDKADFFAPYTQRVDAAYKSRGRKVAYAEPNPPSSADWEPLDIQYG
jgi:uncharacterized protein (DUF488 family)